MGVEAGALGFVEGAVFFSPQNLSFPKSSPEALPKERFFECARPPITVKRTAAAPIAEKTAGKDQLEVPAGFIFLKSLSKNPGLEGLTAPKKKSLDGGMV